MENVTAWRTVPPREAAYAPWPDGMDPRLPAALNRHGIQKLYTHQAACFEMARQGKDYVVVTPTASGKTLCYNLPVLAEILKNPDARALYLFPTKALSADQVSELYELIEEIGADIKTYTYDGDTPAAARRAVRQAGHVVVTNPDMLHSGILPQHTKWVKLFENLQYIVIDEIHTYRGIFGSNLTYLNPELKSRPWFHEVDVSKYIAYFISALNHDASISSLLDPHAKIDALLQKRALEKAKIIDEQL